MNIGLLGFRDTPKPLLAARGILLWDEAQPGSEVSLTTETLHRRRKGLDGQGANRPNAGHRLQTLCRFTVCQ